MISIPEGIRYTIYHEWITMEDEFIGICGISEYAQEQLTDILFVELPMMNMEVRGGEQVAMIESSIDMRNILAPVSGRIHAVNLDLEIYPGIINHSPYSEGWIYKIDVKDPSELNELMDEEEYEEFCKEL